MGKACHSYLTSACSF